MCRLVLVLVLALPLWLQDAPRAPKLEIATFLVEPPTKERKAPLVELKGRAVGLPHGTVIRLHVDYEGRPALQSQVVTEEGIMLWRPELKPPILLPGRYRLRAELVMDDQPLRLQKYLEGLSALPASAAAEARLGDPEAAAAARKAALAACRAILERQLAALKRMEAWADVQKPQTRDELVQALADFRRSAWDPDWKAIAGEREALRSQGWVRPFPQAEQHLDDLMQFAGSLLSLRLRGFCDGPGWPLPEGLDSTGPMTLRMAEQRRDLIAQEIESALE